MKKIKFYIKKFLFLKIHNMSKIFLILTEKQKKLNHNIKSQANNFQITIKLKIQYLLIKNIYLIN